MDIVNMLGGSDNFFKYIFTVGAVMIALSIVYPLQKSQEIDIEREGLLGKSKLLNNEINNLKIDFTSDSLKFYSLKFKLDSILEIKGQGVLVKDSTFTVLRKEANNIILGLNKKERELEIQNIINRNELSKLKLLKKHSDCYSYYYNVIYGVGLMFLVVGFVCWFILSIVKEQPNFEKFWEKIKKIWEKIEKKWGNKREP